MANYLLLYGGGSMPQTDAERASIIEAWNKWFAALGSALVDGGNPFTPQAKSIASDGKVSAVDGGSMASGYSIIKADSLDAAAKMAQGCPVLLGGATITVFETFVVM